VSATEERRAGELRLASPLGQVEGFLGVGGRRGISRVVLTQFAEDDGAHGLPLSGGGTLPENTEALVADAALNVFLLFGSLE